MHVFDCLAATLPPPVHTTAAIDALLTICWPLTAEVGCPLRSQDHLICKVEQPPAIKTYYVLTNSPSVGTLTMLPAPAGISLRMRAVGAYRVFSVNFAFRLEAGPASSILSVEQVLAQTAADRR